MSAEGRVRKSSISSAGLTLKALTRLRVIRKLESLQPATRRCLQVTSVSRKEPGPFRSHGGETTWAPSPLIQRRENLRKQPFPHMGGDGLPSDSSSLSDSHSSMYGFYMVCNPMVEITSSSLAPGLGFF